MTAREREQLNRLRTRVREILSQPAGATLHEAIEQLISEGEITWEELGRKFGIVGFYRDVFRRVVRETLGPDGMQVFESVKGGRALQMRLIGHDDIVGIYYRKKRHVQRAVDRCERFRQWIIEERGFDPEERTDPWADADPTTFDMDDED